MAESKQIVTKIVALIHLGMDEDAIRLIIENANSAAVLREVENSCNAHIREYVHFASPHKSLLETVARQFTYEMPAREWCKIIDLTNRIEEQLEGSQ